jgi:hypothetical protein
VSSSASSADLIPPQRHAAAVQPPVLKSPVKKGVRISDVVQNIETKESIAISPKLSGAEYRERKINNYNRDYDSQQEVEELELENDGEDGDEDDDYDGPDQRKYELTKPIRLGNLSQSPVRRNNSEDAGNPSAYQPKVILEFLRTSLCFRELIINFFFRS